MYDYSSARGTMLVLLATCFVPMCYGGKIILHGATLSQVNIRSFRRMPLLVVSAWADIVRMQLNVIRTFTWYDVYRLRATVSLSLLNNVRYMM